MPPGIGYGKGVGPPKEPAPPSSRGMVRKPKQKFGRATGTPTSQPGRGMQQDLEASGRMQPDREVIGQMGGSSGLQGRGAGPPPPGGPPMGGSRGVFNPGAGFTPGRPDPLPPGAPPPQGAPFGPPGGQPFGNDMRHMGINLGEPGPDGVRREIPFGPPGGQPSLASIYSEPGLQAGPPGGASGSGEFAGLPPMPPQIQELMKNPEAAARIRQLLAQKMGGGGVDPGFNGGPGPAGMFGGQAAAPPRSRLGVAQPRPDNRRFAGY